MRDITDDTVRVVWADDIDLNQSGPLWASVRYATDPTLDTRPDVVIALSVTPPTATRPGRHWTTRARSRARFLDTRGGRAS